MNRRFNNTAAILLTLSISVVGVMGGQPSDNSTAVALEIKTIDLMLAEIEGQSLDDPGKRDDASGTIDGLYSRLVPLFSLDTIDSIALWKLAARYELVRQKLDRPYINAATPMFHIARLMPDYTKDEATLALMAKLNRFANAEGQTRAKAGYRDFVAPLSRDMSDPAVQYLVAENFRAAKGLMFANYKEAAAWYEKAANKGHMDAAARLGAMLLVSHYTGVEQDESRGLALLRQATESGSGVGAYELGIAYAIGQGVAKDTDKAIELYKLALDRGTEGPALFNLMGISTGNDAIRYAELAIEKGYLRAYLVLGQWYLYGIKVAPDHAKGIALIESGAKAGHDSCAVLLAAVYRIGYGTTIDLAAASRWEAIAKKLGAESVTIKETTDRLERRKKMATSVGKETIEEEEYLAQLRKSLDRLKK